MVRPKSRVSNVLMVGPLVPFADDLSSTLEASGYTPLTIVNQLRLMAHVSRWMDGRDYSVADLTDEVLEEYLAAADAAGRVSLCSLGGLGHLLRALLITRANPDPPPQSTAERLLTSFRRHLLAERGLAESTATAYVLRARRFLAWSAADGSVSALTSGDVTRAVLRESQNVSVGSAQFFVAVLRSFLRFCFVEGLLTVDLAPAALAVTGRRRSSLPRGISQKDARALLRACDRRQAAGRRDYAGIPSLLSFPPLPGLEIMRSRTGSGVNVRAFNCSRASPKKTTMSASSAMKTGITRSTPAVRAPLLPLTLSHATVRKSG